MDKETNTLIKDLIKQLIHIGHIDSNAIPDIDLYMDQVTTFMDRELADTKRNPDDKLITKTMINNYAKDGLLPAPDKKKYSRDHMILLIFIYYLKNFLPINDIDSILSPIREKYFNSSKNGLDLKDIYDTIASQEQAEFDDILAHITKTQVKSNFAFKDVPKEDRAELQRFAFICNLCFEIYIKKMLVEKLIDGEKNFSNEDK